MLPVSHLTLKYSRQMSGLIKTKNSHFSFSFLNLSIVLINTKVLYINITCIEHTLQVYTIPIEYFNRLDNFFLPRYLWCLNIIMELWNVHRICLIWNFVFVLWKNSSCSDPPLKQTLVAPLSFESNVVENALCFIYEYNNIRVSSQARGYKSRGCTAYV